MCSNLYLNPNCDLDLPGASWLGGGSVSLVQKMIWILVLPTNVLFLVHQVTKNTRHILVEVTSSTSLEVCKKVMEELLRHLLEMGLGQADLPPVPTEDGESAVAAVDDDTVAAYRDAADDDEDAEESIGPGLTSEQLLIVQQVKVIDNLGGLRAIFPSRVDLQSHVYRVSRDYE